MKNNLNRAHANAASNRLFPDPYMIGTDPIDSEVVDSPMPERCPKCNSENIGRKGKSLNKRTFFDVENGKLKGVTLRRARCICRDCKATFYPATPYEFSKNSPFTVRAEETIASTILSHPEVSVHSAAKRIAEAAKISSAPTVDRIVKKKIGELSDAVSVMECQKLYYIPFSYKSRTNCCAIVGLSDASAKMYLLDILEDSSESTLSTFYKKTEFFKERVEVFLADMNRNLLDSLSDYYPCEIGILIGLVTRLIDSLKGEYFDKLKYDAIDDLKAVLNTAPKEDFGKADYFQGLQEWEDRYIAFDPMLASELRSVYEKIIDFRNECWIGSAYRPWETEFSMLWDMVYLQERNNASFDTMKMRLLYANKEALKTADGETLKNVIRNIYAPVDGPIRSFGVDIKALYTEIWAEKYRIENLEYNE